MRKVIWIGGPGFTMINDGLYEQSIKDLAESVGGEAVIFGTDSYAIIGDDNADKKMKELQTE